MRPGGLPALPDPEDAERTGSPSTLGCLLIYSAVYIEKGMGLIIPGLTPDTLGEIYEYRPSLTEACRGRGHLLRWASCVFTLMLKVAVPIMLG